MTVAPAAIAFRSALEVIETSEPAVADAIRGELSSQRHQINLIASENCASPALTTLGFTPDDMAEVAAIVVSALKATTPESLTAKAKYRTDADAALACHARSADLLAAHPLYPDIEL